MVTNDPEETISLVQVAGVLRRNAIATMLLVLLFAGIAFLVADLLPQRYKSKAILNIQSSYFQHPLVSDLISEVRDPSEMSAQRLSLLRLALNDQFLDRLGEEYRLYMQPNDEARRILNREALLKRIEYFSVSPSSFQISVVTNEAKTSFLATQEILGQMTYTLIERRYQALMQARQAVLTQATLLNRTLVSDGSAIQRETLQQQLATMESNLSVLRARYTESHPEVRRLEGLTQALESRISNVADRPTAGVDDYTKVFLSPSSRVTSQEIFSDLLKKLSHLNIVLEMERDRENVSYLGVIEQPALPTKAFFPDQIQFALIGALLGLLVSGILTTFRELQRANNFSPDQAAAFLGIELLGELPVLTARARALLLDSSPKGVFALPPPTPEG